MAFARIVNGLLQAIPANQGTVLDTISALTSGTGYLQKTGANPQDWALSPLSGGNVDGGFANSTYTAVQSVDGGFANSTYTAVQSVDGGGA